ncbi:unnamed protein product [Peronospora farinosa]|uniref:Uncharacterized protein n=1 Tax=Peronospora farinosa TaxID=134698 RepID=A0AAV0SPL3_9STRA|nr:unnamed protein product [Peronospora farinosa]CAI5705203.1 unnamed protein product [Peronospora farinosa]
MSINSSTYPKALVVALLVSLTTSVISAEATHEGVVRSSGALPRLDAAYTPGSIEQYSRSSGNITTSDDTLIYGERKNPSGTATILKRRLQVIGEELQKELSRLREKLSRVQKDLVNPDSVIADLLDSFSYTKWIDVTIGSHPESSEALQSLYLTLSHHFGSDAALAEAMTRISGVRANYFTEEVLHAQVQWWIKEKKTTDEVFTLLKLDQTNGNPFASPIFSQWKAFITSKNLENPEPEEAATREMFDCLSSHYKDDVVLIKILDAEYELDSALSNTADDLLEVQAQKWKNDHKTEEDVFTLLMLDQTDVEQLLASPAFIQWTRFVHLNRTGAYTSDASIDPAMILDAIKLHYKNEDAVVEILVAGNDIKSARSLPFDLLCTQLEMWYIEDKTPEDVFTLLRLESAASNPFKSRVFSIWFDFVTLDHPESKEAVIDVMFKAMSSYYKDEAAMVEIMVEVLVTGTDIRSARSLAFDLLNVQLKEWRNKGKTPEDVFTLLRLESAASNPFESRVFSTWVDFVTSNHPESKEAVIDLMFKAMSSYYKDEAAMVEKMVEVLVTGTDIRSARSLASDLLNVQLKEWRNKGKTPEDVYMLLKLDRTPGNPFASPVFSKWFHFVTLVEPGPLEAAIGVSFETMSSRYKDDALVSILVAGLESNSIIADHLLEFQLLKWENDGKTAEQVSTLLKLDESSPDFDMIGLEMVWVEYVYVLIRSNPDLSNVLMTDATMARIAKILDSALAKDTNSLGRRLLELRDEQFTQWMQREITLKSAKTMLLKEGVDRFTIERIETEYATFLQDYEMRYEDSPRRLRRV